MHIQPIISTFWLVLRALEDSSKLCRTCSAVSRDAFELTCFSF